MGTSRFLRGRNAKIPSRPSLPFPSHSLEVGKIIALNSDHYSENYAKDAKHKHRCTQCEHYKSYLHCLVQRIMSKLEGVELSSV